MKKNGKHSELVRARRDSLSETIRLESRLSRYKSELSDLVMRQQSGEWGLCGEISNVRRAISATRRELTHRYGLTRELKRMMREAQHHYSKLNEPIKQKATNMNGKVNLHTAFGMEIDRLYQANKPKKLSDEDRMRLRIMDHIRSAAKEGHGGIRLSMHTEHVMCMDWKGPEPSVYRRISNYLVGQGMVSMLSKDWKELVVRWTDDEEYTVKDLRPAEIC